MTALRGWAVWKRTIRPMPAVGKEGCASGVMGWRVCGIEALWIC